MCKKHLNLQLLGRNLEVFTMISARINSFFITITLLLLSGCKKSGSGNTLVETVAVPEPSTLLLLAAGLGGLVLWKSKMK